MPCKFAIIKNFNLSIEKFRNNTSFDEILQFIDTECQNIDFKSASKILTDLRGCIFNPKDVNISKIRKIQIKYKEKRTPQTIVFLTNTPIETAYSSLFVQNNNVIEGKLSVCCTIERAIDLLNVDIDPNEIEEIIECI